MPPPSLDALCTEWQSAAEIEIGAPLSSLLGNGIAGSDVLSVGAISFPPYVGGTAAHSYEKPPFQDPLRPTHGEPGLPDPFTGWSGRLLLDGEPVLAEQSRWCAHRVERVGTHRGWRVHTRVSLGATSDGQSNARAVLFEIELTPEAPLRADAGASSLSLEMQGFARKFVDPHLWKFGHPTTLANETGQFTVKALAGRAGVSVADLRSPAATAVALSMPADAVVLTPPVRGSSTRLVGGRADFNLSARCGLQQSNRCQRQPLTLGMALAIDGTEYAAYSMAQRLAQSFTAATRAASALWNARWADAFTPGNMRYSGHWPIMSGDADVQRVFYLSALSFLSVERRVVDPSVAWSQAYTTGGPRTGVTSCYYWDMPYQATLLTLLDPAYVRGFFLKALSNGLNGTYEMSYFSGKGEGRWYAFNDMSLFTLAMTYMKLSGESGFLWASTTDAVSFANSEAPAETTAQAAEADGGYPVVCSLLDLTTHVAASGPLKFGLSDFGGNLNLLECVPQYQHGVPALNAANGWMRYEMAALLEAVADDPRTKGRLPGALKQCARSKTPTAKQLREEASSIIDALMHTYDGGLRGGVWRSVQPGGEQVSVRTIIDFHTIGTLLGAPATSPTVPAGGLLSTTQRDEMASFFDRELMASGWVRALSLTDTSANVSSFRPDHGTIGSYDAWPAQSIEALVTMGKPLQALGLLKSIATGYATREGPFGQAHTLFASEDGVTRTDPLRLCNASVLTKASSCVARKADHWMMQAYNAAGAAFANAVLRAVFGFQPPLPFGPNANTSDVALLDPLASRGFDGSLHGLRWRGELWTLESSVGSGLILSKQE